MALNLVLQFSVGIETDDTGDCKVVVEECGNNQHSIPLRVLGRPGAHISTEWR